MVANVIANETRNEEIAVVITFVHAQVEWMTSLAAGIAQQFRFELVCKEAIGEALVNE